MLLSLRINGQAQPLSFGIDECAKLRLDCLERLDMDIDFLFSKWLGTRFNRLGILGASDTGQGPGEIRGQT